MSRNNAKNDALLKLSDVADFHLRLFNLIGEIQKSISASLTKLSIDSPNDYVELFHRAEVALRSLYLTPACLIPREPHFEEVYDYHSAFIVHHWDSAYLIQHSIISCLSGFYGAAYSELRVALETFLNGVIYDCLAHPDFRNNVEKLIKIKGFRGSKSFKELIDILGSRDLENSAEILDLVIKEGIQPKASPSRYMEQLKLWNLLGDREELLLKDCYNQLSMYVHRTVPSYSDVGVRLERNIDWLSTEPIIDEIIKFMKLLNTITETCSTITLNLFLPTVIKFKDKLDKQKIMLLSSTFEELGNYLARERLKNLLR